MVTSEDFRFPDDRTSNHSMCMVGTFDLDASPLELATKENKNKNTKNFKSYNLRCNAPCFFASAYKYNLHHHGIDEKSGVSWPYHPAFAPASSAGGVNYGERPQSR